MKASLMFRDQDFQPQQNMPWNKEALTQDLELDTLFNAMSQGDEFLLDVARSAVLSGLSNDLSSILYRQNILKDCLKKPSIVRDVYDIAVEAIERQKKDFWSFFGRYPAGVLHSSIRIMQMFMEMLKKLRAIVDEHADEFKSEGFTALFEMLKKELTDEYFVVVQDHLDRLKFRNGVLISAELGKGNKGQSYVLRRSKDKKSSWTERIFNKYILPRMQDEKSWLNYVFEQRTPAYTFYLHPRDESGARALSELRDRGINLVANALAQSADHILNFFKTLRTELAFYIGCLNLHGQLTKMSEPLCFPLPVAPHESRHSFKELYDVCLALTMKQKIVGSDVNADGRNLVIVTGANQGGKSTFLRSIGLAQLMMQCGMFVPADSFSANICDSLFTHYKREEDTAMKSGKLDEELNRMSDIVDHMTPNPIFLFNESFAATNEREGSEIAKQIISALLERRVKIFFVTHLYEFANGIRGKEMIYAIFLRAERQANGRRTFKIIEGEPLQTSFGEDLYVTIFGRE